MKKLILLITVLSLTSCGLFRKTVKTSSSSEQVVKSEVKGETKERVKAMLHQETSVGAIEQKQVQKDIDENTTLTADEIEVKPNGSIKGMGNAKLVNNRKDKSKTNLNKAIDRTDRYVGHIDVTKENKENGVQETKSKVKISQSQSEPKITFALGFSVIVLIIFLLILLVKKLIKSNIFTKIFTKLKL